MTEFFKFLPVFHKCITTIDLTNPKIELQIEKKSKRKVQLASEVEKTENRIKDIEKHATNVKIEHDYNQKLITAHAAQLEAENNLVRIRANAESSIAQEIRNLEKEKKDIQERKAYLEKELTKLSNKIEESKRNVEFDRVKLVKLEESLNRDEERNQIIEGFIKIDAKDFKASKSPLIIIYLSSSQVANY